MRMHLIACVFKSNKIVRKQIFLFFVSFYYTICNGELFFVIALCIHLTNHSVVVLSCCPCNVLPEEVDGINV